jgi:hypothetical protein
MKHNKIFKEIESIWDEAFEGGVVDQDLKDELHERLTDHYLDYSPESDNVADIIDTEEYQHLWNYRQSEIESIILSHSIGELFGFYWIDESSLMKSLNDTEKDYQKFLRKVQDDIQSGVKIITTFCKNNGLDYHIHEAKSTLSVYVTVSNDVAKYVVRISDHPPKNSSSNFDMSIEYDTLSFSDSMKSGLRISSENTIEDAIDEISELIDY